jgi:hypothetical protein
LDFFEFLELNPTQVPSTATHFISEHNYAASGSKFSSPSQLQNDQTTLDFENEGKRHENQII